MITETLLTWIARFISGASVRWVESQPDTCQRVYFANHTSHLDVILVWSALPTQRPPAHPPRRGQGLLDPRPRFADIWPKPSTRC